MKYIAEFESRVLGSDVVASYKREYAVSSFSSAYEKAILETREANERCDCFEYYEIKSIRKEANYD